MTMTFNKIGKIVAVSVGITLMGAVFTSTKAETTSNEADNAIECSGNEIKTNTSIQKGECEDGKRKGVWKYYDKDGYIQKEITWQNDEIVLQKEYDKYESLKLITAYNKGEIVSERGYGDGYGEGKALILTHYYIEDNLSFVREYDIGYFLGRREETKIDEARKKAIEIANQRAQSKVKKPTMQEVAKSKGIMDSYRAKLKAQEEKELQIELAKIPAMPNFNNYSNDELITYIKNNQISPIREVIEFVKFSPTIEGDDTIKNLRLSNEISGINEHKSFKFQIFKDDEIYTEGELSGIFGEAGCRDNVPKHYTCRTFARHYKQLIDKSAFKDFIYGRLPKPRDL